MIFGYARISTTSQNFDLQYDALLKHGVKMKNIFTDTASGVKEERVGLISMMSKLREGDTVIVWKLDRIARSVIHLSNLMCDFESMGVRFKSLQEPFLDTSSAHGKFIFTLFGAVAQLERDLISERTKAGLEAAALRGRKGGRRTGLSVQSKNKALSAAALYKEGNMSIQKICDTVGIGSKRTLYNYLEHEGIKVGSYRKKEKRK